MQLNYILHYVSCQKVNGHTVWVLNELLYMHYAEVNESCLILDSSDWSKIQANISQCTLWICKYGIHWVPKASAQQDSAT